MILTGDALQILPTLDAESVQCVMTSPPYYGLRDYGTATWEGGDPGCDHKKPPGGGHGESSPIGKGARDIEIMTSQRYFNVCRKCGAVRTDNQIGLEPTPEAYVEKLVAVFRDVRRVLRDDGTVWLNLGDSYASASACDRRSVIGQGSPSENCKRPNRLTGGLKEKDLIGIPWRVAFALQADGWWLRSAITWIKNNPMPESVTDRPTKSTEMIFLLAKNARYYYDAQAIAEDSMSVSSRGANFTPLGGSTLGPEINSTLHTNNRSSSCRGWCDLGSLQEPVNLSVTRDTECFQILNPIGLKIGIKTPEGVYVVDLKNPTTCTALDTLVSIALAGNPPLRRPISALIGDCSTAPSGAILSGHVTGNPDPGAYMRTEVASLECALIPGEWFSARIAVNYKGSSATLLVWDSLSSTHDGSLLADGINNITTNKSNVKRNKRDAWFINTRSFSEAHFATFPPEIPEICIKAGTSEKGCCPECGSPWERILQRGNLVSVDGTKETYRPTKATDDPKIKGCSEGWVPNHFRESFTTGWRPTCTHNLNPVPCTVLDPFSGAGTTGIVAEKLGRKYIGIELKPEYVEMSEKRRLAELGGLF